MTKKKLDILRTIHKHLSADANWSKHVAQAYPVQVNYDLWVAKTIARRAAVLDEAIKELERG